MATPRARGGRSATSRPPIRIDPDVGVSSPAIMRRRVVLPQPEGPSSTRNSPSVVAKSTPSTAWTSPSKCLASDRTSTVATASASSAYKALVTPFLEDGLDLGLGVGHRLLRAGVAPSGAGHHLGQHEGAEDLALGSVGGAGIADVDRPGLGVLEYCQFGRLTGAAVVDRQP